MTDHYDFQALRVFGYTLDELKQLIDFAELHGYEENCGTVKGEDTPEPEVTA